MMFARKSKPRIRSLIGDGSTVRGEVRFTEGLRIDGEVQGDVLAQDAGRGLVVISENARVSGMVNAAHVIINGEVRGPVLATELLELQPKARVIGDVRYEVLEMHPGATIDGELRALKSGEAKPPLKLAASNEVRAGH